MHSSTFGGNPLVCAAAYAAFKYIVENDVAGNARDIGQYLKGKLENLKKKYPFVTEVRGSGLLLAMEFNREIAKELVTACLESGLLVNRVKPGALRFMPPLIIGKNEVDEAVSILDKTLSGVT